MAAVEYPPHELQLSKAPCADAQMDQVNMQSSRKPLKAFTTLRQLSAHCYHSASARVKDHDIRSGRAQPTQSDTSVTTCHDDRLSALDKVS